MINLYELPVQATFGEQVYHLHTDFRVILKILQVLEEPVLPEVLRWRVALGLFYDRPVPPAHQAEAMEFLADFLRCGQQSDKAGPKLLDWQQDAPAIISGVNAAAGCEVRAMKNVHWWTFLSWFHAMPPGQLSTVVSIRDKLRRGKQLEPWEKEFYRENKAAVDLKRPETEADRAEKERLNQLLGT